MKKDWNGRKADQLGTLVSKNDMMVAFLPFLFLSYIPDLGLERQQPSPNNGCRKSKGPGKRQPIKTEIFHTIAQGTPIESLDIDPNTLGNDKGVISHHWSKDRLSNKWCLDHCIDIWEKVKFDPSLTSGKSPNGWEIRV